MFQASPEGDFGALCVFIQELISSLLGAAQTLGPDITKGIRNQSFGVWILEYANLRFLGPVEVPKSIFQVS